jgi:hypothetical protein
MKKALTTASGYQIALSEEVGMEGNDCTASDPIHLWLFHEICNIVLADIIRLGTMEDTR